MNELRPIGTEFTEHYGTYQKEAGELGDYHHINEKSYTRTFKVIGHKLGQFGRMVEVLEPVQELERWM